MVLRCICPGSELVFPVCLVRVCQSEWVCDYQLAFMGLDFLPHLRRVYQPTETRREQLSCQGTFFAMRSFQVIVQPLKTVTFLHRTNEWMPMTSLKQFLNKVQE